MSRIRRRLGGCSSDTVTASGQIGCVAEHAQVLAGGPESPAAGTGRAAAEVALRIRSSAATSGYCARRSLRCSRAPFSPSTRTRARRRACLVRMSPVVGGTAGWLTPGGATKASRGEFDRLLDSCCRWPACWLRMFLVGPTCRRLHIRQVDIRLDLGRAASPGRYALAVRRMRDAARGRPSPPGCAGGLLSRAGRERRRPPRLIRQLGNPAHAGAGTTPTGSRSRCSKPPRGRSHSRRHARPPPGQGQGTGLVTQPAPV